MKKKLENQANGRKLCFQKIFLSTEQKCDDQIYISCNFPIEIKFFISNSNRLIINPDIDGIFGDISCSGNELKRTLSKT